MKKLVSYLRLSKEDDSVKDESNSITNQRILINEFVLNNPEFADMEMVELKDDGYTGKNMERPGMQQLLAMVKSDDVACIIVKDISRFSRDYLDSGKYLEQIFPFMGIRFIAINDNYDSDKCEGGIGEIDIAFKEILYDFYSVDISNKVKSVLSARRASGKYIAVFAPYGYKKSENDKYSIVPDEEAAVVVKRIYREYLEGKSMYNIAQRLNENKVYPPAKYMAEKGYYSGAKYIGNTKSWTALAISRILRNEVYTGTYVYGYSESESVGSKRKKIFSESEWQRIFNHHEAIISEDDYLDVQRIRNGGRRIKRKYQSHYLKGKVVCANCGHRMSHTSSGRHTYECRTHYSNPNVKGCIKSIRDDVLDNIIIAELQKYIDKYLDTQKVIEEQRQIKEEQINNAKKRLANMTQSLDKIELDLRNAYESYKAKITDKETYINQKRLYEDMTEKMKNNIQKQMKYISDYEDDTVEMPEGFEMLKEKISIKKLDRELVDTFIEKIVVGEESVEVIWKFKDGED